MSKVEEFEKLLKAAVGGKRLSQSKMTALTALALANFEYDTQLVSILYRAHKSLPTESKVPSLYIFDSLARAARSQANQSHVDSKSSTGNAATFLAKIEGVLDGLIQDMIATGSTEAKEKTLKVLDIWTKANTFPPPVLARLTGYTRDSSARTAGIDNANSQPSSSTTSVAGALAQGTVDPRKGPTPPNQLGGSTLYQAPVPETAGLLALLAQAQATATPATTASSAAGSSAPIDPAQLALLQQIAGNLVQPNVSSSAQHGNSQQTDHLNNRHSPRTNRSPDHRDYRSSDYPRRNYDDRSPPPRDRYDDRDRRRSYSDRSRWDDRDGYGDRRGGGGRSYDRDGPSRRGRWDEGPGRRRSRSPGYQRDGYRGPPSARPERERDGRDSPLQSANPSRHGSTSAGSFGPTLRRDPPYGSSSSPPSKDGSLPPTSAPSQQTQAPVEQSASQATIDGQSGGAGAGLQAYDFTSFDPTNPACWDSLGKAWEMSYGKPPAQEELMMFVMSGGMAFPGGNVSMADSSDDMKQAETNQIPTFDGGNDDGNQSWNGHQQGFQNSRGRGRGRGRGFGYTRGGYGGGRNGHGDDTYGGSAYAASSDAVALGGGDGPGAAASTDSVMLPASTASESANPTSSASALSGTVATKGQMVKIGDKWKWVKKGDIIP